MTILPFPVSRAKAAFQFSVEALFRNSAKVYMWTITFKKAESDDVAMYRWNQMHTEIKNNYPLCQGLRVTERHPGEVIFGEEISHGLHFHLLLNWRIPKDWLEKQGHKWGFGFTFVRKVTIEDALYCGKYLMKENGTELKRGGRKWGTVGGFKSVKIRDVEINSTFHRNFAKVQKVCGITQVTPDLLHSIFLNSEKHGEIANWPNELIQYGGRSRELINPEMLGFGAKEYANPTMRKLRKTRRSNRTEEQRMQRRAKIWAAVLNRRRYLLGLQAEATKKYMDGVGWQQRQRQVESETKPSENFLVNIPRGIPGASPVKIEDRTLSKTDYYLDKNPRKWVGTGAAINTVCRQHQWNWKG